MVGNAGRPGPKMASRGGKRAPEMPTGGAGGSGRPPRPPRAQGLADFGRKAANVIGQGLLTSKSLATAASPAHFMFRHALGQMVAHPRAWLYGGPKGIIEGLRMSRDQVEARIAQMQRNLDANGVGNLYLGHPHGGITRGEEDVAATWFYKLSDKPVLGGLVEGLSRTQNGFVMGLNEIRYNAVKGSIDFSNWAAKKGFMDPTTVADRRAMADAINRGTGRGVDTRPNQMVRDAMKAMGKGEPITMDEVNAISRLKIKQNIMRALNVPMFSPQLAVARVRVMADAARGLAGLMYDAAHGNKLNAADFERARQGVGLLLAIGATELVLQQLGGQGEGESRKTNFGKVDVGQPSIQNGVAAFIASQIGMGSSAFVNDRTGAHENVLLDPTASEAGVIRFLAREVTSLYDAATGQKTLQKAEGARSEDNPLQVAYKEIIRELFTSPLAYPLAQWMQGYAVSPASQLLPMPINAALDASGHNLPSVGGPTPKPAPAPKSTAKPRLSGPRPGSTPKPLPTVRRWPDVPADGIVSADRSTLSGDALRGMEQVGFGPMVRASKNPQSDGYGSELNRFAELDVPRNIAKVIASSQPQPAARVDRAHVGTEVGMGGLLRAEDRNFQSSDVLAKIVGRYLPADMQKLIVNRQFQRVPDTSWAYGGKPTNGQGGYYVPVDHRIALGQNIENAESPAAAQQAALHEALHAISYEYPPYAKDQEFGYPQLAGAIAQSPGVSDRVRYLIRDDPDHAFTELANQYVHGVDLGPALNDYFSPFDGSESRNMTRFFGRGPR